MEKTAVKQDTEREIFYTEVDGIEAYVNYLIQDNTLNLVHTYTPPQLRGRGLASEVVKFAFEYAKQNNLKVIPTCSFIPVFVERNPQYNDLVAT